MQSDQLFVLLQLILFLTGAASFVVPPRIASVQTRIITSRKVRWWPTTRISTVTDDSNRRGINAVPSLYEEQEKLLVKRGELEAALMAKDGIAGIEANVVKGAGGSGGFGGGAKKGASSKKNLKAQAKEHAKVLRREGVVRIDNVLPKKVADDMRDFVYTMRKESEELVRAGEIQPIERFADVLLKSNRCDMPIPLGSKLVADALLNAIQTSPVGKTIEALFGANAMLYELSCLMSDPGSSRQNIHPDTPCSEGEEAVLYTCFMALQDITIDMGPTTWIPKTHTVAAHSDFQDNSSENDAESKKDRLLRTQPSVLGLLPKGSCGIFDSRLLHCGGANESDTSRALFYVSFKNPKIGYPGNPGSIRKNYISQFTLSALDKELTKYKKGKESIVIS